MPITVETLPWDSCAPDARAFWAAAVDAGSVDLSCGAQWTELSANVLDRRDTLAVAIARDAEGVVAVLPFYRDRRVINRIPVRTIELAGNMVSYHQEAIGSAWVELFNHCVGELWQDWDVVIGANLLTDGVAHTAFTTVQHHDKLFRQERAGDTSPYIELSGEWTSYLAGKPGPFRSLVKRRDRRLSELGVATTRWYRDEAAVAELLSAMLAIEDRSWKVDSGMNIKASGDEARYYAALLPWLARAGRLAANVEMLDDNPLAYSLCYLQNRRYAQLKTSFDNEYRQVGIGMVALKNSVVDAYSHGCTEYDFLGDSMRHKLEWATHQRAHVACFLFGGSLRGRALGLAKAWFGR